MRIGRFTSRRRQRAIVRGGLVCAACTFMALLFAGAHSTVPTLAVGMTPQSYVGANPRSDLMSAAATTSPDLAVLLDLWGVAGGPPVPMQTVEAPDNIRAGSPLEVDITCVTPAHAPLINATAELDWLVGDATYHDVGFTNDRGQVAISRQLPQRARGQRCLVSVRVHSDDLRAFAYCSFTPR